MANKMIISISIDEETITRVDELRGMIPRSTIINWILEDYVKEDKE